MPTNVTRTYGVQQEDITRDLATGSAQHVKRALSPAGRPTFVHAESSRSAEGKPRKLGKRRTPWSRTKIIACCNNYLKDIERFIAGEFAGPCDTDDGEHLLEIALPLLVARHVAYGRKEEMLSTKEWAMKWVPQVAATHPAEWFAEAEQRILSAFDNHDGSPSLPPIDAVSRALGITAAKRESYGLKHLPAVERPRAIRKQERKAKNRAGEKARRAKNSATPREASISARKPWEAHGISRATYYRRVETGMLPADPAMRPVLAILDENDQVVMRLVG